MEKPTNRVYYVTLVSAWENNRAFAIFLWISEETNLTAVIGMNVN